MRYAVGLIAPLTALLIEEAARKREAALQRAQRGVATSNDWPTAAWYAFCVTCDPNGRPLELNATLQDYAVKKGVVFG